MTIDLALFWEQMDQLFQWLVAVQVVFVPLGELLAEVEEVYVLIAVLGSDCIEFFLKLTDRYLLERQHLPYFIQM